MSRIKGKGQTRHNRPKNNAQIVVAGDVCIDWLEMPLPPAHPASQEERERCPNWRLYKGSGMVARPGGALLLARLVGAAANASVSGHSTANIGDLEKIPPKNVVHSMVKLQMEAQEPGAPNKTMVYRVQRLAGFDGPANGQPKPLPIVGDTPDARIVVLDDAGNGFRNATAVWPAAIRSKEKTPIVVLKMNRPLMCGKLWAEVQRHAARLVVVLDANDLRAEGASISRALSWERTATDFSWQMALNPTLEPLRNCAHIIVRFGLEAAIYYSFKNGIGNSKLVFIPNAVEDETHSRYEGSMLGFNSVFCAALVAQLSTSEGLDGIEAGISNGILSSQRLLRIGFGIDRTTLDYPVKALFSRSCSGDPYVSSIAIPDAAQAEGSNPQSWSILNHLSGVRLEKFACEIVTKSEVERLRDAPEARFNALKTFDRNEIESFRAIRNLMLEYLSSDNHTSPLSVAVFGPPGSGKSFGITQVASSVAPGKIVVDGLEFNLSQFQSLADLVSAFHKVRDIALTGKIPLVFFDEFDSECNGVKLGWLKYFLAPMQNGRFKDGETTHPTGRAIFVFAGGTSSSYENFVSPKTDPSEELAEGETRIRTQQFADAKGPDFISRLRGYVNIMGPNPMSAGDKLFMVRRAVLLRSILSRKARHVFDGKELRIDKGVLLAYLRVPVFKHGVRSMEAIIDMSMLAGRRAFESAALPTATQLSLHVDAETFLDLVRFAAAREGIARAIHKNYLEKMKQMKKLSPRKEASHREWERLSEEFKESNRLQADEIPVKLKEAGCTFAIAAKGKTRSKFALTPDEIEFLAEMEHERYVKERFALGWTYAPGERNNDAKTHPCLVSWSELPEEERDKDRDAVKSIPDIMANAGFDVIRLDKA